MVPPENSQFYGILMWTVFPLLKLICQSQHVWCCRLVWRIVISFILPISSSEMVALCSPIINEELVGATGMFPWYLVPKETLLIHIVALLAKQHPRLKQRNSSMRPCSKKYQWRADTCKSLSVKKSFSLGMNFWLSFNICFACFPKLVILLKQNRNSSILSRMYE